MDKKDRLKRIEGIEKQKEKHKKKIEENMGKVPSYTIGYWEKEIARMDDEIRDERRRLDED